ncbi:CUG-BP- and ETR-3-like factor 4 [Cricetulus griseus]|uniref:CUG-BP-and ETR-3-like factor 4 n=1 Tax=Cricetulus griseus TaxID=10029 RepID=G3I172_CRIGR|nr:CUG-BP- and ETR-3-like factor 4 [Cricetulus griseus]
MRRMQQMAGQMGMFNPMAIPFGAYVLIFKEVFLEKALDRVARWVTLPTPHISVKARKHQWGNGGSTPPGITAPAVPSIPSPIGVNGFTGLPPQANGQPAAEAVFANGIHPYPAQSPTAADPLQQAYAGVQQYAGR